MHGQGLLMQEIADALGVGLRTVHRWKAKDLAAGADWDARREERARKDPHVLIRILEDRLHSVASAEIGDGDAGAWADTLQKISNVLNRERERVGDLSVVLGVLGEFASWCHGALDDDHLRAVSRATEGYLSHLKGQSL